MMEIISEKYNSFRNAFKVENLKIHYAAKALTLKLFKELGAGLDCVSIEEIGLKAGFQADDIIFTPNGVSLQEYQ